VIAARSFQSFQPRALTWFSRTLPTSCLIPDLPASVIAIYEATARERGIALDQFLREYLIRNAPSVPPAQMSPDEWEWALDECFDSFPSTGPLPNDAFRRENIYGREDKW
jgi:hypothetical protein